MFDLPSMYIIFVTILSIRGGSLAVGFLNSGSKGLWSVVSQEGKFQGVMLRIRLPAPLVQSVNTDFLCQ